jgi:hypothetical protein
MNNQSPPNWAKDAVASPEGWRHARTGELLKSQKLEMNEVDTPGTAQMLTEAPVSNKPLKEMDTTEVEALQETSGIRGFFNSLTE